MKLKKFLTLLLSILESIIGIISCTMPVQAATYNDYLVKGEHLPGIYVQKDLIGGGSRFADQMSILYRKSDMQFVYCVQPAVPIDSDIKYNGSDSEQWTHQNLTKEQWDRVALLAYYGYGYNSGGYNHTDKKWYAVAQFLIWQTSTPERRVYFTDGLWGEEITKFTAEIAELNKLVSDHYKLPSFNNSSHTVAVGDTINLTDTNGVLSNYTPISNSNLSVVKNGNNLSIVVNNVGDFTLKLQKNDIKFDTPPIIYYNANSQNFMSLGKYDPLVTEINIRALGGSISLEKIDYDNNSKTTSGLGTLAGAVYDIYDSNRILISSVTTNANGSASLSDLPPGIYYIRERTPSIGYLLDANEYMLEITESDLHQSIVSKEQIIKGRISINKVDAESLLDVPQGDATLSGAVYEIRNSKNILVATLTTNSSGYAISGYLPYDNYTIKEISPSVGYLLDSRTYYISIVNNNVTYNTRSYEQVIKGRIKIDKLDNDYKDKTTPGESKLQGAIYEIFFKGILVDTVITDKDGYATSKLLPYGHYSIKEKTASEGYLLDLNEYEEFITIDQHIYVIQSYEQVIRRDIELLKSYSEQQTSILVPESNITFQIINKWNHVVRTVTTDAYGYVKIEGLPYGHYVVRQINSPSGIEKMHDFTFNVNNEAPKPIRFNIVNNALNLYLKLIKIDNITKEVISLSGIKFKIFNIDTGEYISMKLYYPYLQIIDTFETNSDGFFLFPEELKVGNYRIEELNQIIDGYTYNDQPLYFTIDGNTEFEIDHEFGNILTVYFENQRVTGKLEITKEGQELLIENNTYEYIDIKLSNVKFNIYADEDIFFNGRLVYTKDTLIDTIITNDVGTAEYTFLYLGKYYLIEIESSNNNAVNNDKITLEFKYFNQYTSIINLLKTINNEYKKGTLEFTKTDLATGKVIPNTLIEVYTINDELIFTGITDENGMLIINDLFIGEFYIIEKEPSTGYKISDAKIFFEILDNGDIIKLSMTNEKIKGMLEIIKTDGTNNEYLPSALFEIYDEYDNLIYSGRTDELGRIIIENIEYGKYYIIEKEAPTGYEINSNKIWFDIINDGEKVTIAMTNELIPVPNTGIIDYNVINNIGYLMIVGGILYVFYDKRKNK